MENKQTALEWLKTALIHDSGQELQKWISDLFDQAIELEKQQIIETYKIAQVNVMVNPTVRAEQYYSETYKKTTT